MNTHSNSDAMTGLHIAGEMGSICHADYYINCSRKKLIPKQKEDKYLQITPRTTVLQSALLTASSPADSSQTPGSVSR